MRIRTEDILKPGAVLRVEKIDFEKDPEVKKLFEETKRIQKEMRRIQKLPFKNYTITI